MKDRTPLVLLVLLAVVLGLAYWTWTRDRTERTRGITLVDIRPSELTSVKLDLQDASIEVVPRRHPDSGGEVYWVTRTPKTSTEGTGNETESYKGNEAVREIVEGLAPFEAAQAVGTIPDEKLSEFELSDTSDRITISAGGREYAYRIGGRPYGKTLQYIQDPGSRQVYLMQGRPFDDLKGGSARLMERTLHSFKTESLTRVEISAGDRKKILIQSYASDPKKASWADVDKPAEPKDLYKNWMDKILRLRAMGYLPVFKDVKPVLELHCYAGQDEVGYMELREGTTGIEKEYFAHTEITLEQVRLNRVLIEEILKDLDTVLAGS
ncbi:MAG: DUF4340 domain-containing protein [Nitrospirae bacterium]|nr:DUF4340 domain-containing protein [Nitrospirota bacterium]